MRRAANRAMNLSVLHRRLMQDVLEIGNSLPVVITGGYAVQAHQLADRLSRDLDVATDSAEWYDDQAFAEYGLSAEQITDLRGWARAWADDILRRIKGWELNT